MPKPIFTWLPDADWSEEPTPDVLTAKFGDGYSQRSANGLNHENIRWSLTFTGNRDYVMPIRAFLKTRGGVESFQWTSPFNETGLYTCDKYTVRGTAPILMLSATFLRVYEAGA